MMETAERKYTLEEFEKAVGDKKADLAGGHICMMAPASPIHSRTQAVILRLAEDRSNFEPKRGGIDGSWIVPEAWTFYDSQNVLVHDVAGFRKSELPSLPTKGPIKVKPFWVCEVLSPSNWSHDTETKRLILQSYSVPYYWIVDPLRKSIQAFKLDQATKSYLVLHYLSDDQGKIALEPFGEIDLTNLFDYG